MTGVQTCALPILKATSEKATTLRKIEEDLEGISNNKIKAKENLDKIKKEINREISKKEKERTVEINNAEIAKNETIKTITAIITENKVDTDNRIKELKKQQNSELNNKGADTKRLSIIDERLTKINDALIFIKNNERTVFEYEKDKRELFDKVPKFKADKTANEKKQITLKNEQKIEIGRASCRERV